MCGMVGSAMTTSFLPLCVIPSDSRTSLFGFMIHMKKSITTVQPAEADEMVDYEAGETVQSGHQTHRRMLFRIDDTSSALRGRLLPELSTTTAPD